MSYGLSIFLCFAAVGTFCVGFFAFRTRDDIAVVFYFFRQWRSIPVMTASVGSSPRGGCADFCGRVPFASLISVVLCWVGVGLFCTMMYYAVNASLEQAQRVLGVDVVWLDKVQLVFICVAVIMGIVALALLVIGALATGSTRNSIYSGWGARLGGRISCALFLLLTYVLNLCWLFVVTLCAILAFIYLVFSTLCLSAGGFTEKDCLNFTVLSPVLNGTVGHGSGLVLCGSRLSQFCALTETASTWYYVGYFGGVIVVLGLIHFMVCLAANYAHIKDGSKYMQLQEIWQLEENEMQNVGPAVGGGPQYGNYGGYVQGPKHNGRY